MPRNSRSNEEKRARTLLTDCLDEFEEARPYPRSAEDDIIFNRLKAAKNDVRFARAFLRVWELGEGLTLHRMIEASKLHDGFRDSRYVDLTALKEAKAAIPSLIRAVEHMPAEDYAYDFTTTLKKLQACLEEKIESIGGMIKVISSTGLHRRRDALRYFVRMIDRESGGRAGAADLVRLAQVALGNNKIDDKAVSVVRLRKRKRRGGPRTRVSKPT